MSNESDERVFLPPRWFIRLVWYAHRWLYRISGGRFGLRRAKPGGWGMMRLATTGRRTGKERSVILGYLEDGEDIVTMAMNGWADPEPAWWLNLKSNPTAILTLPGAHYRVRAREASEAERPRLWAKWQETNSKLDAEAALRTRPTAVVILEPDPMPVKTASEVAESLT